MISVGYLSGTSVSARSQNRALSTPSIAAPGAGFAAVIRIPALTSRVALVFLTLTIVRSAWAETPAALTVERKAGAEGCPDLVALTSRVERIHGRSADNVKVT